MNSHHFFTGTLLIFISQLSNAPLALGQPEPRVRVEKVESDDSPYRVVTTVGTGVGVFQDVQVPFNEFADRRGDGTAHGTENADHFGFPLFFALGMDRRNGNFVTHIARFDVTSMRGTMGPAETQSSSYSKVQLSAGGEYSGNWLGIGQSFVDFGTAIRRSSFTNVSSSHYVDSLLLQAGLGVKTSGMTVRAFGAFSPLARFGYSKQSILGGKDFKSSRAAVAEFGAVALFPVTSRVTFETGLEQERAQMILNDLNEYEQFGIAVRDSQRPTRQYDLATTTLRVGIKKEF